MPFEIVRNDIVNMQVDAIVNTANPAPVIGYGCDAGIHKAAGPKLLTAREKIGAIGVGQAAVTKGYGLPADYVIHAVGPVWQGGTHNEEALLRQCYDSALEAARKKRCHSVAFPLLSAGNHGFPKELAMQIAIQAFSHFLMKHEMQIYLVVFSKSAVSLSEKLVHSVASYIDETYVFEKNLDEYGVTDKCIVREAEVTQIRRELERQQNLRHQQARMTAVPLAPMVVQEKTASLDLESMLRETDGGFSETLLKLIDRTGKKDSEIYKKANIDRKLFSKIRKNKNYKPSKSTALAFAIALELDLEETKDLIGRAGFTLTHSSKFDIIVEYFIKQEIYDIHTINVTLFDFDQSLLGA
ncbi:MAG: macro domain-containing protein [Ruminiclostridium sp.]|nr:macro domain-containing protein [Ruminiclostridium sp.]